ncbi:hypothetical protein GC194_04135 [bacterium]|nr:hypothetical protein [bacterium]
MDTNVLTLILYTTISLTAAVVLGQNLYKNGEPFLKQMLPMHWVKPVNQILLVGFYLVNVAFVLLYLSMNNKAAENTAQAIAFIFHKTGVVFFTLGIWHFCNLLIINFIAQKLKKTIQWTTNS